MPRHGKRHQTTKRPQPPKRSGKPQETVNKNLARQIRKDLRTHYANKYQVR